MDGEILYVVVVFIAGFIGFVIGRTTATLKAPTREDTQKIKKGE